MSARRKLTVRQRKAITALLSTDTLAAAAGLASCGERTLRRWLRTRTFFRAYELAAGRLHEAAMASLLAKTGKATEQLVALLTNNDPNIRVRAAIAIVDRAARSQETKKWLRQLEKRVEQLGEVVGERPDTTAGMLPLGGR